MRQLISGACVALCLAGVASGGDIRVAGQDVDWSPSGQPSLHYVVAVENVTVPHDRLLGWQLSLKAVPATGSTGTLQFNSIGKPPNYVLGDGAMGITFPDFSPPSTTTGLVFDDVSPAVAVAETGQNLVDLEVVSNSALGRFDIMMLPGEFDGSCWISEDVQLKEFYGAPLTGPPVRIGSITVLPVPEPASGVLIVTAVAAGVMGCSARRKRTAT